METAEQMAEKVLAEYGKPEPAMKLPSQHQIGDGVYINLWSTDFVAEVIGVHFYPGKVKYDIKVFGDGGEETRLYNVDSVITSAKKK